eukprot:TRINITY_DN395_c0_g2_i1.p1 TRINITY_DN395_c0_g2~~TRINITY_DN395_c0_g2_i1.p1  ORF type:complete len:780 (+),score=213.59 TRINITY_DN395_c0_g2_i1:48-2387(+)
MIDRIRWREALDAGNMEIATEIRAAADKGDGDALMMMGVVLQSCNLLEPAAEYFKKGAEAGSTLSMYHHGTQLISTTGSILSDTSANAVIDDNTEEAVRWFKKSVSSVSQQSTSILPDEEHAAQCSHFYLACVSAAKGDIQQAATQFEQLSKTISNGECESEKSKALLAQAVLRLEKLKEQIPNPPTTDAIQEQETPEPPAEDAASRRAKWRTALESGDLEIAPEIRTFAENGDGDALLMMGCMLQSCNLQPAALEHYKKGADAGSSLAMYHFASEYITTTGPILTEPSARVVFDEKTPIAVDWFERCVSSILLRPPGSMPEDEENAMICSQFYLACAKENEEDEKEALEDLKIDIQHTKFERSKLILSTIQLRLQKDSKSANPVVDSAPQPEPSVEEQQKQQQQQRELEAQQQRELQQEQQKLQRERELQLQQQQKLKEQEEQKQRELQQQQQEQKQRELQQQQQQQLQQQKPAPKITLLQNGKPALEPKQTNNLIGNLLQPTISSPPSNINTLSSATPSLTPTPTIEPKTESGEDLQQEVRNRLDPGGSWKDDLTKLVLKQGEDIDQLKLIIQQQQTTIKQLSEKVELLTISNNDGMDPDTICFDKKLAPPNVMISPDGMTVMIPRGSSGINLISTFILDDKNIVEWDVHIETKESSGWSLAAGVSAAGFAEKPGQNGWGVDQSKKLLYTQGKGIPTHTSSWQAGWIKNKYSLRFRWEGASRTLRIARSKPAEVARTDFGFHSLPITSSQKYSPAISVDAKYSDVTIKLERLTPEGQ